MAKVFDFPTKAAPWSDLAEGEVKTIMFFRKPEFNLRMLITKSGSWEKHIEKEYELYIVLQGEVIYSLENDISIKAGQAILFEPGEAHGARIETGAVSIKLEYLPPED
jgi:quercetin dioxygenase-like cupin family protein